MRNRRILAFIMIVIVLIGALPIEIIADSETEVSGVLKEFREYYEKKEKYNYLDTLTFKSIDKGLEDKLVHEELSFEIGDSFKDSSAKEYAKAIIGIISLGKDPRDYKGKNYVDFLVKSQNEEGDFITKTSISDKADDIAFSILALDMAGADYKRAKAIDLLKSKFTIEDDMAFIKEYSFYSSGDIELTAISTIALNKDSFIKENHEKLVNFYKSEKISSGMIGGTDILGKEEPSAKKTSLVIQSLVSMGENIDIKMIEGLIRLQNNQEFKEDSTGYEYSTSYVLAAFADYYNEKSMYNTVEIEKGEAESLKIFSEELSEDNTIKLGKKMNFQSNIYDSQGLVIRDTDVVWETSDKSIVKIDEYTGEAEAIKPGKVEITGKIKGKEIKDTLKLEVLNVEISRLEILLEDGLEEIQVGKDYILDFKAYDKDNILVENPKVKWKFNPEGLVSYDEDRKTIKAKESGDLEIQINSNDIVETIKIKIKNDKELLKEALGEVKTGLVNSDDKYNYSTALSLSSYGMDKSEIASKITIKGQYGFINNEGRAENIIAAISVGKDPKNFEGKNYVEDLLNNDFYDDENKNKIDWLIKGIIALDMSGENYDSERAIENLVSRLDKMGNRYFLKYKNGNYDNENTAMALIALSNHRDKEGIPEVIDGIVDHLNSQQKNNGLIGNTKEHSLAIQGLMAAEEDIYSEKWTKNDKNGKITLLDALLRMRVGNRFKPSEEASYPDYGTEEFAFAALVDLFNESSMYRENQNTSIDKYEVRITKEGISKEIKQGNNLKLEAKVYRNNESTDLKVIWESSDNNVLSVDEEGNIKALLPGKAIIKASVEGFPEFYDEIEINVIKNIKEPVDIKIVDWEDKPIIVGDKIKLKVNILDENGNKLDYDLEWKSLDEKILKVNESGEIQAISPGNAKIIVKVKSLDLEDSINISVLKNEEELKKTINSYIDRVEKYYNTIHFRENNGTLDVFEISSFKKAGLKIDSKWYLEKDYRASYDINLKYLGNKSMQALAMVDQGRDPRNYKGRDLIKEIAGELNNPDYGHGDSKYLRGLIAVTQYNKKNPEAAEKINTDIVIDNLEKAQLEDGGFKERGDSVAVNTGYALQGLSEIEHERKDEIVESGVKYLKNIQKEDGAFYEETFVSSNNVEIIKGLLYIGEDLTSENWIVENGKNPIDSIFTLWDSQGRFDNLKGESANNRGWITATQKSLYLLGELKSYGYGNYILNSQLEEPETPEHRTLDIETAIVQVRGKDNYEILSEPGIKIIDNKKHYKGFNVLGALEATTSLYTMTGSMVDSIYGIENKGMGGWMYTVNDKLGKVMAGEYDLEEGDKVLWYYSPDGMEGVFPKWNELLEDKDTDEYDIKIIKNESIENNRSVIFEVRNKEGREFSDKKGGMIGLFNKSTGRLINYISLDKLNMNKVVKGEFLVPKTGEYEIKEFSENKFNLNIK